MLLEVGLIAAGVPVGFMLRKRLWALGAVNFMLTWAVRLLLFFLGLAVGADAVLLEKIDVLGGRALAVSLLAVLGSLGAVWLVRRHLSMDGRS